MRLNLSPEIGDIPLRVSCEKGIYQLFLRQIPFKNTASDDPYEGGFANARLSATSPVARKAQKGAIDFANQVLCFMMIDCGIDPELFLAAVARYGTDGHEETEAPVVQFMETYLGIGQPNFQAAPPKPEDCELAAAFIEDVGKNLEAVIRSISNENPHLLPLVLAVKKSLANLTEAAAISPSDESVIAFKSWAYICAATCPSPPLTIIRRS